VGSWLKQPILVRRSLCDSAAPAVIDFSMKKPIFAGKYMVVAIDYALNECGIGFLFLYLVANESSLRR
jgi:hypothetical protein